MLSIYRVGDDSKEHRLGHTTTTSNKGEDGREPDESDGHLVNPTDQYYPSQIK